MLIICLLLMLTDECWADDEIIDTKIIYVGGHVKMMCSRKSAGHIFWMRIAFGKSPENLEKPSESLYSQIKVTKDAGTLELQIINAKQNDSAVYLCVRKYQENITYLKTTLLRVEELPVTRAPSSASVHPKVLVTLQCSVLRDFQNTSCPVDDSMNCFTAELTQTHPSFSNIQVDEGDKYKNNSEGFTAEKCFYGYLKNFSSSGVRIYSCGEIMSEKTLLEDKSKLNDKGVNTQDSKYYNTILYLLCGALAVCLVIIACQIYLIATLEKKANGKSDAIVGLQAHSPLRGNQESQQMDDDSLVYSAPVSSKTKTSTKVRRSPSVEQETIYTEVNILRL